MKKFLEILKSILMSCGIAAICVSIVSIWRPDIINMRFLRVLILIEAFVTVLAYLIFSAKEWRCDIWTRRIVVITASAAAVLAATTIAGILDPTWKTCAIVFGLSAGVSFPAFAIADRVEKRILDKINDRLDKNKS